MWSFDSILDTVQSYGADLAGAATAGLKGAADATVAAAVDTLKNAGTAKSAITETHKAVQTGVNANGSTVLPMPSQVAASSGGGFLAGPVGVPAGVPVWVWYLAGGSLVLIVGGVTYRMVTK